MFKNLLKDYFHFTSGQRKGLLGLFLILLLIVLFPLVYKQFLSVEQVDFSQFAQDVAEFEKQIAEAETQNNRDYSKPLIYEDFAQGKTDSLFLFNPNKLPAEDWAKLGVRPKTVRTIHNYERKGGSFRKPEDLKKIYGLSEQKYKQLEPFILIEETVSAYKKPETKKKEWKKDAEPDSLFMFDPNTIDVEGWVMLGVREKTAKTIEKYRSKGGTFKTKEDIEKIYGFRESDYERLEPYISIEQTEEIVSDKVVEVKKGKVNINLADSAEFVSVRGIGPVYYRRIKDHGDRLGGFHSVSQLLEVYGIDSVAYKRIAPQVEVAGEPLKQISINKADRDRLKNHPYIKYNEAKAIVKYREQHGEFNSLEDLKKIFLIDDEWLEKLRPYLKL